MALHGHHSRKGPWSVSTSSLPHITYHHYIQERIAATILLAVLLLHTGHSSSESIGRPPSPHMLWQRVTNKIVCVRWPVWMQTNRRCTLRAAKHVWDLNQSSKAEPQEHKRTFACPFCKNTWTPAINDSFCWLGRSHAADSSTSDTKKRQQQSLSSNKHARIWK